MTLAPPELLAYLKVGEGFDDSPPQSIEEKAASPYARSRFDAAMGVEGTKALLEQLGYHSAERHRGYWLLTRPGKGEGEGHSVSVGQIAPWVVKVFSSNDPYFAEEQTVDAHTLYAIAHYEGDLDRAEQDFIASYGGLPWPSEGSQELAEGLDAFRAHAEEEEARSVALRVAEGTSEWDEMEMSLDDLENLPDLKWFVDQVFPKASFCVVYGKPKAGKSFVVLDLVMAAACGLAEWNGQAIVPSSVAWLAGEGHRSLKVRTKAWLAAHPEVDRARALNNIGFYDAHGKNLRDPETLQALADHLRHRGHDVLVVDTINMLSGGMQENDAQEMSQFTNAMIWLSQELGITVICVHHLGKDRSAGLRGHSSLEGAVYAGLLVERDTETGYLRLNLREARDSESGYLPTLEPYIPEGAESLALRPRPHEETIAVEGDVAKMRGVVQGFRVCGNEPQPTGYIVDVANAGSERKAKDIIAQMLKLGWLERVDGGGGRGRQSTYRLTPKGLSEAP